MYRFKAFLAAVVLATTGCREVGSPGTDTLPTGPTGPTGTTCAGGSGTPFDLGSSISGSYSSAAQPIGCVALVEGDTIDLGLWFGSNSGLAALRSDSSDGNPPLVIVRDTAVGNAASRTVLFGAVTVPKSRVYRLYLSVAPSCPSPQCTSFGSYTLRSRRSAPILLARGFAADRRVGSDTVRESTWFRNVGAGSVTLTFSARTSNVSVGLSSATLAGPSETPTYLTIAIGPSSTPGIVDDAIDVGGMPTDVWQPSPAPYPLRIRYDEADYWAVTTSITPVSIAVGPAGEIVAANGRDTLFIVDRQTGAVSVWRAGLGGATCCALTASVAFRGSSLAFGADSAVYFTRGGAEQSIVRVRRAGTPELLAAGSGPAFAVLPDLSMFHLRTRDIFRRSATGESQASSVSNVDYQASFAFSSADSALYFLKEFHGSYSSIQRLSLRTNTITTIVAMTPAPFTVYGADRFGRVYAISHLNVGGGNRVAVIDSTGTIVGYRWPPYDATALWVSRDTLYGADFAHHIWALPIRP